LRKTNYSFQKRQRDLAKQQKRDAKRDKKQRKDGEPSADAVDPVTGEPVSNEPTTTEAPKG